MFIFINLFTIDDNVDVLFVLWPADWTLLFVKEASLVAFPPPPPASMNVAALVVDGLLMACFKLVALFFGLNGAFWNTIAKPLGDGRSSAPCTALQRRNIVRPMINLKILILENDCPLARFCLFCLLSSRVTSCDNESDVDNRYQFSSGRLLNLSHSPIQLNVGSIRIDRIYRK